MTGASTMVHHNELHERIRALEAELADQKRGYDELWLENRKSKLRAEISEAELAGVRLGRDAERLSWQSERLKARITNLRVPYEEGGGRESGAQVDTADKGGAQSSGRPANGPGNAAANSAAHECTCGDCGCDDHHEDCPKTTLAKARKEG